MATDALILLAAVAADIMFGDPPNRFHPVAYMGKYISWAYGKRSKFAGSSGNTQEAGESSGGQSLGDSRTRELVFGAGLVIAGIAIFTLPLIMLSQIAFPGFWIAAVVLLELSFSIRGLVSAGFQIKTALEQGSIEEARRLVGLHLVSRDTSALSTQQVVSATLESFAENITDSVTAPLFFFVFLGVPGAWGYRFCNTCDAMLGYRDPDHEYGGKFAARLDTILNWVPARITACLISAAALFAGQDARNAWATMTTQHERTASPNAGWTMSAFAGALGVRLEKQGHYTLEGGSKPLDSSAIDRAMRLVYWTVGLVVLAVLLLMGLYHVSFA